MPNNTVYKFLKEYKAGDVIFKQGDKSDCMYEVEKGRIDLYIDYGKSTQKKIAEIGANRFMGEMGMVEGLPRSATAIVGSDYTVLAKVTWDLFGLYFRKNPAKVVQIMQQMGDRLRITTKTAMDLKTAVNGAIDIIQDGGEAGDVLVMLKNGIHQMDATLENNK